MLIGTLAASLLQNMLAGKAKIPTLGVIRADGGTIRAGDWVYESSSGFLMLPHPQLILKYKNLKMNQSSMVFIQEIIYLKQRMRYI